MAQQRRTRAERTILAVAVSSLAACSNRASPEATVVVRGDLWSARWENLGGEASQANRPAAASWGVPRLDVFWRSTQDRLHHRWFPNNTVWSAVEDLGPINSAPTAVSKATNEIDVFSFDSSRNLVHRSHTAAAGWVTKPTITLATSGKPTTGSSPSVASWTPGRLDVFWRGTDDRLKHIWRSSYTSGWTSIEDLGETNVSMSSSPGSVSWGSGRIDVFWQGSSGELRHKWFPSCDGCNTWAASVARTASGTVSSAPDVASWEVGRLDVFWKGSNGQLLHTWRVPDGTWWGGGSVEDLGGVHTTAPGVISRVPNLIDVFMAASLGNDMEHLAWQMSDQTQPLFTQPPVAPTVVASNDGVVTGNPWEFSVAASPPSTACTSGAFAVSGSATGRLLFRVSPLTSTSAGTELSNQMGFGTGNSIRSDNVMTRAKNGDLLLVRAVVLNVACTQPETCSLPLPPGCSGNEARSAAAIWRSSDCGANWSLNQTTNLIDPKLAAYGNGTYGGSPCWGGWDREESYYDYWSDRLFITVNANPAASGVDANSFKVFRSASNTNGDGPYTMHNLSNFWTPAMMTSLPGMLFMFTCTGGAPTVKWIDPNAAWSSDITNEVKSFAPPGETCAENSVWPGFTQGSDSVTRVTVYTDDSGTKWWVVRLGYLRMGGGLRVATVRVNAAGTGQLINSKDVVVATPPSGQANKHAMQLTAIEPYPIFDGNNNWIGENTTLYYWREEYWSGANTNPQNVTRAMVVRDINAWGAPVTIGAIAAGKVDPTKGGPASGMPGDYAKGAFWFDPNASNLPLRYLVVRGDIPSNTTSAKLRSTILALPRGLGN